MGEKPLGLLPLVREVLIRPGSIMAVEEGKDVRVGVEDQPRRKGWLAIVAVLKRDGCADPLGLPPRVNEAAHAGHFHHHLIPRLHGLRGARRARKDHIPRRQRDGFRHFADDRREIEEQVPYRVRLLEGLPFRKVFTVRS
jgi:hypothetical protein